LTDLLSKGLPQAAADAAKGMADNLSNFQLPDLHERVVFDTEGGGPGGNYASAGGVVTRHGIAEYFASGGFPGGPMGSDTIPAWLTSGEAVLNRAATSLLGADTIRSLNRGTF